MDASIEVVVYLRDFADEQEAIEYAIASQRNRRNLTEAEIVRCVLALDKLKAKGGDRKSNEARSIPSSDGIDSKHSPSAKATAKLVGTNSAKVERTRRLAREAPDLLQEVVEGKQNDHLPKTAEVLGKQHGVSPKTIRRDGDFAAAVEVVKKVDPQIEAKVVQGSAPAKGAVAIGSLNLTVERRSISQPRAEAGQANVIRLHP